MSSIAAKLSDPDYRAFRYLVWVAMFLLPVTGVAGIGTLGELKGSASVHVLVAALLVAVFVMRPEQVAIPRPVLVFLTCLAAWIAVVTALNFETIATSVHHGRSGVNKLITSLLVVGFGMLLTTASLQVLRTASDVERWFVRPLVWAVVACSLFALPELWSWASPTGKAAYDWTTALFHDQNSERGRVLGRLISLAFEAPDLSYFCALACPWMLLAYRWQRLRAGPAGGRARAALPLVLCLALLVLSNSRTGFLMLAGIVAAETACWIGLRRFRLPAAWVTAALVLAFGIGSVAAPWAASSLRDTAVAANDVSTMTRLALLLTQLSIFRDNPVFGVGLGQYGFHASAYLPSWAWNSYEIANFFEVQGDLPPSFNVSGRIGAELGIPGLLIWYGFWLWAIMRCVRAAAHLPPRSPSLYLNAALLSTAACFLLGGISNDAFRRPETWILIAITGLHAGGGLAHAAASGAGAPGRGDRSAWTSPARWAAGLALAWAGALGELRAQPRLPGPDLTSGLSVQFTDKALLQPGWRQRLDLVSELGATVVRVDLNWPWVEKRRGQYDWSLYDDYVAELASRSLRPVFILHRPNPLYGATYNAMVDGVRRTGTAPPTTSADIAAFARWAAAAATRYRQADPIWEIWNEPDMDGFWPPTPRPRDYAALARATCAAIKQAVPAAVVSAPAAAQIPTVWASNKPLLETVLADAPLLDCLDAISVHTHRFGQRPETLSRDFEVFRRQFPTIWSGPGGAKPIFATEWGDSVTRTGISEGTQASWLVRMFLVAALERVALTNWYCLWDTGPSDSEVEDRFGLVAFDGRRRPAYDAYRVMARELKGMSLREVIRRFDVPEASGPTVLRFCDARERCKLAAWTTEDSPQPSGLSVPGWVAAGPIIGQGGRELGGAQTAVSGLRIDVSPEIRYVPVTRAP